MPGRWCSPRFLWISLAILAALLGSTATEAAGTIEVRPQQDPTAWQRSDAQLAFEVERREAPSGAPSGSVAVFLGPTDITDLFLRRSGERPGGSNQTASKLWQYRPELWPLPPGETELVFWWIEENQWTEAARLPLKVRRRSGLESFEATPRLDLQLTTDPVNGGSEPPSKEERLSTQIDFQSRATRGGVEVRFGANILGVAKAEQALRFGEDGEDADRVDLSSWSLELTKGKTSLGLGHVSYGSSRHLIENFSSRGLQARAPLGSAVDLSFAALRGSSRVGWDDLLGLSRSEHRIEAARIGIEFVPSKPGMLRFEATALDGSLLPLSNFNQGSVTDREQSRGLSLRLSAADTAQRIRFDGAWSESRFINPVDPFLAQGEDLVAVAEEKREARYADLSWTAIRRQPKDPAGSGRSFELAFDLRHQRVDPQYRTVAAYIQSDRQENGAEMRWLWGGLLGQLRAGRSRDNLDNIPSILTTKTDREGWTLTLPMSEIGPRRDTPSPWLPTLAWSGERQWQRGQDLPINGGFSESHVPDQVQWNQRLGLDWNVGWGSFGLEATDSEQDNRQPGREKADFGQSAVGLRLNWMATPKTDLGLDVRQEEQVNEAAAETTRLLVVSGRWTLRLPARVSFGGNVSWTETKTPSTAAVSKDWVGDAEWSWSFQRQRSQRSQQLQAAPHGFSGQLFVRGAYTRSRASAPLFDLALRRDGWKVTTGLNLGIF